MPLIKRLRQHPMMLGSVSTTLVLCCIAGILSGFGLLHFGQADTIVRVITFPEQPSDLERFQTLASGILTFLGGLGAIIAGVLAYKGAIRGANLTAEAAMHAAQIAADEAARDRQERFNREDEIQIRNAENFAHSILLVILKQVIIVYNDSCYRKGCIHGFIEDFELDVIIKPIKIMHFDISRPFSEIIPPDCKPFDIRRQYAIIAEYCIDIEGTQRSIIALARIVLNACDSYNDSDIAPDHFKEKIKESLNTLNAYLDSVCDSLTALRTYLESEIHLTPPPPAAAGQA